MRYVVLVSFPIPVLLFFFVDAFRFIPAFKVSVVSSQAFIFLTSKNYTTILLFLIFFSSVNNSLVY